MKKTNLDSWILNTEGLPALTREALDALQLEKLNALLSRLRQRGGIYRDYPKHLDSLSQLETLPFTTAEQLAAAPGKFLLTSQSDVSRVISGATSGTTGKAKRVFYTEQDTEYTVGFFAAGISEMLQPGEKCCIGFPFSGPFGLGDLIARAVEQIGGIPIRAGFGQCWAEPARLVREKQPETFIGFPVPLLGLARMMGEDLPIRKALLSGDACPHGVLEELKKILGGPLYPHYGSRECGLGGAVTCPAFEGMHLRENHILQEVISDNGRVLPDGQWGELVITTIGLEAMPLIRYRTGDHTRILPPCPCGSVTKRIDRVLRKEGPISMAELDNLLFRVPQLVDFQACWDGTLHIDARLLESSDPAPLPDILQARYPGVEISCTAQAARWEDRPRYLSKRFVISR